MLRDLDLIAPMAAQGLARVYLSVTTLDADLARKLEPRASAPARRIEALRELVQAGVPTGVMIAPVIPQLTDRDLEAILEAAADAGVTRAGLDHAAAAARGRAALPRLAGDALRPIARRTS